jgi:glycosyltransferase involved in cell wall biosynthesis
MVENSKWHSPNYCFLELNCHSLIEIEMNISVIICAHNPRKDYLQRVLAALKNQTLPKDQWEMLLIDNASKELLSEKWNLSWHPKARHIREEELGLTPARLRGIREAKGEILVFVDDDCELVENYLQVGLSLSERHPVIGAWSGQCMPVFESEPPEWSKPHWGRLTIRVFNTEKWSNDFNRELEMPWGAGLFIRKEVALFYSRKTLLNSYLLHLDRRGASLTSCGDLAMVICSRHVGMGFGIFPQLKLKHLIPSNRLNEEYFSKIIRGHIFSWILLQYFEGNKNIPPMIGRFRRSLGRFRRKFTMPRRERLFFEALLEGQQEAVALVRRIEEEQSS